MKGRSRARRLVLQVLYAWEMQGQGSLLETAGRVLAERGLEEGTDELVRRHLEALEERRTEIDAILAESTTNWEFHRLSVVDRNVLRLAACELMAFPDVPFRVVIDEAVKLARRYGGDESPRFVNGVLDAVRIRLSGASTSP
ncbi:MAG: transcription antitermination factor NusB [Gemmatimonadetes bacterium]|nr:transcription antitermination factor NusB [Gemmatimonadota bacterium]